MSFKELAKAVELSSNKKLGGISTTYTGIQSCPDACPFKASKACYGMSGPITFLWRRMWTNQATILETARAEAKAIDTLTGEYDLRIHTLGDCQTNEAAKLVSNAAERHMKKKGKLAFTYTHGWREVSRESWGKVSVLASCETSAEVEAAKKLGYATAIVVDKFDSDKTYTKDGMKIVPCPEMTGKAKSCEKCRLCMRDNNLKEADVTIAFAAHGPSKKMKAVLEEKNG